MNAIEFYHAHHTAVTAALVTGVHLAHLAWPRVKQTFKDTFLFCRGNGGVEGVWIQFWKGQPAPAGEAALLASIKQIAVAPPAITGGTAVAPQASAQLNKTNE